jgi:hypothetical protein
MPLLLAPRASVPSAVGHYLPQRVLKCSAVGIVYPLLRFSPAVYSWLQHRRIYKLYSELLVLEDEIASSPFNRVKNYFHGLDQLEDRASRLSLPMSFQPLVYTLRVHIGIVRQRAEKQAEQVHETPTEPLDRSVKS